MSSWVGLVAGTAAGGFLQFFIFHILTGKIAIPFIFLGAIVGFVGAVAALATQKPTGSAALGFPVGYVSGCLVSPLLVFAFYVVAISIYGGYEPEMIFGMALYSFIVSLSGGVNGLTAKMVHVTTKRKS